MIKKFIQTKMLVYISLIYLLNIIKVLSIKILPNDFLAADNPYEDDLEVTTEAYHHIITTIAAISYIDYYKGIYFKKDLCCKWGFNIYNRPKCNSRSYTRLTGYTKLNNINDTNLKLLQEYGCPSYGEEGQEHVEILFDYRRHASDSLIEIQARLSNYEEQEVAFELKTCKTWAYNGGSSECTNMMKLDNYTIPNNSFLIYTFKVDQNYFYVQSENFTIPHPNNGAFNYNREIFLYFFPMEEKKIYLHSYIISVNLFKYVLSLGGHAHNYCTNKGCINYYSCVSRTTGSESGKFYACDYEYSDFITECSLFGCIPGSYCNKDETCIECDYQCRTCTPDGYMKCMSCYSNAIYPQWKYYRIPSDTAHSCIFEFYPLNKVESYDIQVPIPLSYRVTFEFWIYIHDPKHLTNKVLRPSLSSFILKDFFTISLHQSENKSETDSVTFILTPFEFFYPFKKEIITMEDFENIYLTAYPKLQYLRFDVKNVTSKWFYVRGGLSYTHNKIFINDQEKVLEFLPVFDGDDDTNYHFLMRKFYRRYEATYLKIQGFEYINTDVYVRNLNFYSDYMFNEINNPNYFNMHEIPDILTYPQLLFSVPFTNVSVESVKLQVKYKVYDFSGQFTDVTKSDEQNTVVITEQQARLIRDYLAPSKNFYRLNFLNFANKEYLTTDIQRDTYLNIECYSTEHKRYCYDDGQPYICQNGYNLIGKYKDLNITDYTNETQNEEILTDFLTTDILLSTDNIQEPRINYSFCVSDCIQEDSKGNIHKFMRLPNNKRNQASQAKINHNLCTYECDPLKVENCPSATSDNIQNFQCYENETYSFFYKCLDREEFKSENSALQFSGTLNTKSIYFPLNQDLYNFYIEAWFHIDLLTQEDQPLYTKYFFSTNNHHMYFDVDTQQFMITVYNDEGIVSNFNLMQKIYFYGWNHLIFYAHEEVIKNVIYTTFTVSLANNLIDVGNIAI